MFIKIILSMIIILSTSIIGYMVAYKYAQRLQQLKNLYVSFQLLETEIIYASNSLPFAMKKVGERSSKGISKLFIDTHKILHSKIGYSIEEAWNKAIRDNIAYTFLENEDGEILIDFGKNLGNTDKEYQVKNFKIIYTQLEKQQQIANDIKIKNVKMCKSLGVLIGIAIVIVFI